MRILIVDDSANVRRLLRSVFGSLGFEVIEAASGPSALRYLRRHSLDAIVTDFNMPAMDGLDFVERARRLTHLRAVPVFVLSSDGGPDKLERAARCGVAAWLTKPMNPSSLVAAVAGAMAS